MDWREHRKQEIAKEQRYLRKVLGLNDHISDPHIRDYHRRIFSKRSIDLAIEMEELTRPMSFEKRARLQYDIAYWELLLDRSSLLDDPEHKKALRREARKHLKQLRSELERRLKWTQAN